MSFEKFPFKAEYLSREDIRVRAQEFLKKYHPEGTIPVPIEKIIDLQFKIDIVSIPGLRENYNIDAYFTKDLKNIFVDRYIYDSHSSRFRFSLAHEMGHYLLHYRIYQDNDLFKTVEDWKDIVESIPEEQYTWLEFQAYEFGGQILVPLDHLQNRYKIQAEKVRKTQATEDPVLIKEFAIELLAEDFAVSTGTIRRRIDFEKLPLP
ncbi:MAG: ImmA/IrrE family metallo-endopeptidase [Candidatus Omnitrophota bacterium]